MRTITPSNAAILPDGSGGGSNSLIAATLDQIIPITADVIGVYATFWTPTSNNVVGGAYYIALYAEIYNTTLNVGCSLVNFSVQWEVNGVTTDITPGAMGLDVNTSLADSTFTDVDNAAPVEWKIDVAGWASGAGTLRVKASLLRLA